MLLKQKLLTLYLPRKFPTCIQVVEYWPNVYVICFTYLQVKNSNNHGFLIGSVTYKVRCLHFN